MARNPPIMCGRSFPHVRLIEFRTPYFWHSAPLFGGVSQKVTFARIPGVFGVGIAHEEVNGVVRLIDSGIRTQIWLISVGACWRKARVLRCILQRLSEASNARMYHARGHTLWRTLTVAGRSVWCFAIACFVPANCQSGKLVVISVTAL